MTQVSTRPPLTTAELLREARELIERCGWWQGDYYPLGADWRHAPTCASGALYVVAGYDPHEWLVNVPVAAHWLVSEAVAELQTILDRRGYRYALTTWNDDHTRTRDEVLELLATAAGEAT